MRINGSSKRWKGLVIQANKAGQKINKIIPENSKMAHDVFENRIRFNTG